MLVAAVHRRAPVADAGDHDATRSGTAMTARRLTDRIMAAGRPLRHARRVVSLAGALVRSRSDPAAAARLADAGVRLANVLLRRARTLARTADEGPAMETVSLATAMLEGRSDPH